MTRKPLHALEGTSVPEKNKAIMQRGVEGKREESEEEKGGRKI